MESDPANPELEQLPATFIITDMLRNAGSSEEEINKCIGFVMNTNTKSVATPEIVQTCRRVADAYIESLKRPTPNLEYKLEETYMIFNVFGSKNVMPVPLSKAMITVSRGDKERYPNLAVSFQSGLNKIYWRISLPPTNSPGE